MEIKLIKIKELNDALHPNNIDEGFEIIAKVDDMRFEEPIVGCRFCVGTFSTSGVLEIIDKNTFRTYSSIYEWRLI